MGLESATGRGQRHPMLSMNAKSLSEQNCPLAKRISLTLLLSYRPLLVRALWRPMGRRYDRPGDGRKHHCHAGPPNRLFTRGGTTERSAVLYPAFAVVWRYNSNFRRGGRRIHAPSTGQSQSSGGHLPGGKCHP